MARRAGDPLLISAAYDAVTAGLMTRGDIPGAAATAAERVSLLPALGRDPRAAFELKDALHTAIFTGVAAGQIARSLDHAERHYSLPFLREERYLGSEDLIAPAALAGQWDRVLALARQWRRGWEHAGRPVAVGRSMTPAAVAMVHGLRGDDVARAGWLAILAAVRGVAEHDAVRGSGGGEVFEAIVLLDRGEADAALDLLTAPRQAPSRGGRGCGTSGWRRCGPKPRCWRAPRTRPAVSPGRRPRPTATRSRSLSPGGPGRCCAATPTACSVPPPPSARPATPTSRPAPSP